MNDLKYEILLVDDAVTLEQLQPQDADRLFELTEQNREYLSEYLPWPSFTKAVDDSRSFIESTLRKRAEGQEYGYGIKCDGNIVGHISLMHLNDDKRPEIGYWIAAEYNGKGITTRATAALTKFALTQLNIPRLIIRADVGNIGSNRVAEKVGYVMEGQETVDDGKVLNIWSKSPN